MIIRNSKIILALAVFFLSGLSLQAQNDSVYMRAIALYQYGSFHDALDSFKSNLESKSINNNSYLFAGLIELENSNIETAIQYLEKVEEREKGKASFYLSKAYAKSGNLTKCLTYLDIHLKSKYKIPESKILLDPDFERFENEKSWITFWNDGNYYSRFDRLLADADYAINNEDYLEALNLISDGLDNGYRKSVLLEKRADTYILMKNNSLAISDLNLAIESDKRNSELYEKRGDLNFEFEKYKQSLNDYNQSIKLEPENFNIYLKRARAFQKTGDFENALKDINFFRKYYPEESESLYKIGKIYMEEGLYLDALIVLNKCLSTGKPTSSYYLARGESFLKTRTYKNADRDLAMALDLDPSEPEIWFYKGLTNVKLGNNDHACFCFGKSFQLGKREAYEELMKSCPDYFK